MSWSSLNEFMSMGGYGLYVWGAFGVSFAAIAAEVVSLRSRRKALRRVDARAARPRAFAGRPREA